MNIVLFCRRWAEIVGELKQENMYLERKVEHLNNQLKAKVDYEDSCKSQLKETRDQLKNVCKIEPLTVLFEYLNFC